mmetsp:Transcript_13034/g.23974  ORF Transcript_13034/g.23974 Transcript_13034/m.23974 type:complete len:206 (+) Transcript_13034:64-681(+)
MATQLARMESPRALVDASSRYPLGLKKEARRLDRTIPEGGIDENFAQFFAEVTLDCIEEQLFNKRINVEVGPRLVHLRRNALEQVTIPPHIEENKLGRSYEQKWTGHPKVDKSLFMQDRVLEYANTTTRNIAMEKSAPALRAAARDNKKNFGTKPGPTPFGDSYRASLLNRPRKAPAIGSPLDTLPMTHEGENKLSRPGESCRWR